ncbi:MAG: nodulation protein NfeD [Candidatus Sumerlaeaceae bacterium]|nr:nodulation protein NfeD [Candidatus Sumerlaeaceae bacterium]
MNRLQSAVVAAAVLLCALIPGTGRAAGETTATVAADSTATEPRRILLVKMNDEIINPVTSKFMVDAIERGSKEGIPVVIELDTPGGLLQSTRELVKAIFASRVPVITYIYPAGSRAASAGTFITMASHVAAMSPTSNIGAAHPVSIGGTWKSPKRPADSITSPSTTPPSVLPTLPSPFGSPGESQSEGKEVMEDKVVNDTLAWIQSISEKRGRNAQWGRDAVEKSVSIVASEALKLNVIDVVAEDLNDLLKQIDSRKVKVEGGEYTLRTANAQIETLELSERQKILNALANPNVAYFLLLVGFAGLVYEITHPGILIPGIVGLISLLLAALSLQMLPTNYAALLLIMAGIGLIIAEIKFTSYGLLTVAGVTCLFFGSLSLIEQQKPFIGVSLSVIIPTITTITGLLLVLVFLVIRAQRHKPFLGDKSFIGEIAEVARDLSPTGKVFYNGTYWDAESKIPVTAGSKVRIVSVDRMRFIVEPAGQ